MSSAILISQSDAPKPKEKKDKAIYDKYRKVASNFPTGKTWPFILYKHPNHSWYGRIVDVVGAMAAEKHFEARVSDVIVTSFPKSGTTWTMALLIAIVNRHSNVRNFAPHDCVLNLEQNVFVNDNIPDLSLLPSPRLFASHMTYSMLPKSVFESKCKIIYVWRDPKDVFVSMFHFALQVARDMNLPPPTESVEEAFDVFCEGNAFGGPFWDHVLGYWKASLLNENVLFLRYEDRKKDPRSQVKTIAEFVGKPFNEEEEKQGGVDDVIQLCSLDSLRNMEVNMTGRTLNGIRNTSFYRKGQVGDWANHFTPQMKERMDQINKQKFHGSGIAFSSINPCMIST